MLIMGATDSGKSTLAALFSGKKLKSFVNVYGLYAIGDD